MALKRKTSLAIVFILLVSTAVGAALGAMCSRNATGLSIELTVRERSGVARHSEPVTSGVPFARSAGIKSTDGFTVTDSAGHAVPAQFKVTSRWGGSPENRELPIRWLLVDFQADVAANGTATYYLSQGGPGNPIPNVLNVTRNDGDFLEVSTGPARFGFSRQRFKIFDSVFVGDSQVISPAGQSGVEALGASGERFGSSGAPREVVLETDGPLRKTVRISGSITGGAGSLLDYTARVSLFANSTSSRIQFTVTNLREPQVSEGQPQCWDIGCPNSAVFEDLTLVLDCEPGGGEMLHLGGAGGSFQAPGSLGIYQDSSGSDNWQKHRGNNPRPQSYVSFQGFKVTRNGAEVASGRQASPYLDCSGSAGGLAVTTRDFWQNYPKALRGTSGKLEVSLFPAEYAGLYSFRPGEQKTHEVTCHFHGPGFDPGTVESTRAGCQDPLFAAASPGYYLSTGAPGRVTTVSSSPEFSAYEQLNRATLDGDGASLYKAIADSEFYSWQDYGDVPIDFEDGGTGTLNQKYNFDLGMMLQYLRAGDFRWFRLAEAGGKHVADLDVLHSQGRPDVWWEGGFFGHSQHDEDSNANPNRNYGGLHPDLVFGAPGLYLLYYLTGDRVARDTAVEISDNVKYRFDNSFGRGNDEGFAGAYDYENGCESPRPFAHGLWVLVDAYRATGDTGYLDTAEWLIQNSHKAVDLFLTDPVLGDRRYTKLFTWDLLEFSLGRYLDLCGEAGRADNLGAKDLLLRMTRQEAYVMWKVDERGNKGVPYAWMRDGTPWGWEEREVAVNVCNWHLLTADALTYGFIYGGDAGLLEKAGEAFKTGSNPNIEYYRPEYTATKEATNSANFGQVYIHLKSPPSEPVTSTQFDEWICLENPGGEPAGVTIQYYFGDGGGSTQAVEVPARTRRTVDVNAAVGGGRDVSATVMSNRPIVAERPMYFNYHGTYAGGHDGVGATSPALKWHFAEGTTRPGFEEWLTIQNAEGSDSLVTLTYMLEGEGTRTQHVNAPAHSRTTVNVNDFLGPGHDVSTLVDSQVPVVVERPMYFRYREKWAGGHNALGAKAPSTTWYFAEGTTRANPDDGYYEQWLCLQNPNPQEAHAHVSFLQDRGGVAERDYALAPMSRKTIDVNLELGPDRDVSTELRCDLPIVAERPLYYTFRNAWDGGDDVVGAVEPGKEWNFAEGCTRDGFHTWLCLGNPQNQDVAVTIDYFLGTGRNVSKPVTVPARSRATVDVNMDVGAGEDVSCRVTAGQPIIAERPMYFDYHGKWAGGHVAMGTPRPGTEWHFAEGCTR